MFSAEPCAAARTPPHLMPLYCGRVCSCSSNPDMPQRMAHLACFRFQNSVNSLQGAQQYETKDNGVD